MSISLELLNKQNSKITSSSSPIRLFPESEEEGDIIVNDISIVENKLKFDLDLSNLAEIDFTSVKIMQLTPDLALELGATGFPSKLSLKSQKIIFSNDKHTVAYKPSDVIEGVSVTIPNLDADLYSVLIILEDFPLVTSEIFLLQVPKEELLLQPKQQTLTYKTVFSKSDLQKTSLKIKEGNTYTSNLLYSCKENGDFTGLYCLDLEKFIVDFTKFPNLLFGKQKTLINDFIYKTEAYIYKYDKQNAGYNFSDFVLSADATPVDDLAVLNAAPYRFYEFTAPLNDQVSQLQVSLKIYFNDITINAAKQALKLLIQARNSNDRSLANDVIFDIYEEEFSGKFNFELKNIFKISNLDYDELLGTIIQDFSKEINNASQKVVVNTNAASQYTFPYPSFSDHYLGMFEQKFDQKIFLGELATVESMLGQINANGSSLASVLIDNVLDTKVVATSKKQEFQIKQNLSKINKFVENSEKDILITNVGLQEKINISDSEEKSLNNLADLPQAKFVEFSSSNNREIKLYYLAAVGNRSPVLLFDEVGENLNDILNENNKILVRVDNYEEFYNSYFYVTVGAGQ
jgi:hypothetical protein